MALKPMVSAEDHAKLPADVAKEYTKKDDGSFLLSVAPTDGWALEDVSGLKNALSSERDAHGKVKDQLKIFEGIDPKKAKDAIAKVAEIADFDPDKKLAEAKKLFEQQTETKYSGILTQERTKFDTERTTLQKERDALAAELDQSMIEGDAVRALTKHKGSVELLLPHVLKHAKRMTENGKSRVVIVDSKGQIRVSPKAGNHGEMILEELVEEMRDKETYSAAFEAEATGSGASGTGVGTRTVGSTITISAADAKDVPKYQAAKAVAEKAGKELVITS